MNYYTYIYFDPVRNEPFYVGKGSNNRSTDHLRRKDHHPLTYRLQKMISESVQPIIQKIECSSEQTALDLEIGLIKHLGRKDIGTGTLLNLTPGGEAPPIHLGVNHPFYGKRVPNCDNRRGSKLTEEQKQNQSLKMRGRKVSDGMLGKHHSEVSRGKIGESNRGRYKNKTWFIDPLTQKRMWADRS